MIALLAILRTNQQHSCSIPFHMGVQQTTVEFTHSCHYYWIIHVNDGCQTNWLQLTTCRLQAMHMELDEQNNARETTVHQFIRDIEQFARLQLPVFTDVTIQQNRGNDYFIDLIIN